MFALNRGSINEFKDFFHVFIALPTTQIGLAPFKANTFDNLLENGEACGFTYASSNLYALVITSLVLALLGQRNWNDSVDSIEES